MTNIIDGRKIGNEIEALVRKKVHKLKSKGTPLRLDVILVGNNRASQTYVNVKRKASERAGIDFHLHQFASSISKSDLISNIKRIQKNSNGLLIQLPLPEKLYKPEVLNAIDPGVDVDCLTHENLGRLVMNTYFIAPPTPLSVITILKKLKIDLKGKNITLIGTGALVGKPLAIMLVNEGASITTCDINTRSVKEKCLSADIIVTGVGKKNLLTGAMVKPGAIVIDTGFVYEDGKLQGDINFKEVAKKAKFLTPTPGGIGPITVSNLLLNTVICAERSLTFQKK